MTWRRRGPLGFISLLVGSSIFASPTTAQVDRPCRLRVEEGVSIPAGELAEEIEAGATLGLHLVCPVRGRLALAGGFDLGFHSTGASLFVVGTEMNTLHLLAGPELLLGDRRSPPLALKVGVGWTFTGTWGAVIPERPPRFEAMNSSLTTMLGAHVSVIRSNPVGLFAEARWVVVFADSEPLTTPNVRREALGTVSSFPLYLGVEVDL